MQNLVKAQKLYLVSVIFSTSQNRESFFIASTITKCPINANHCRYFPRPKRGETLTSFLTSNHFSRGNAELDRENAHFNISEAMISAMEQIRCKRDSTLGDEHMEESDPEIMDLKQRIRLRRKQKLVEMQRKMWAASLLSDGRTESEYVFFINHPILFI